MDHFGPLWSRECQDPVRNKGGSFLPKWSFGPFWSVDFGPVHFPTLPRPLPRNLEVFQSLGALRENPEKTRKIVIFDSFSGFLAPGASRTPPQIFFRSFLGRGLFDPRRRPTSQPCMWFQKDSPVEGMQASIPFKKNKLPFMILNPPRTNCRNSVCDPLCCKNMCCASRFWTGGRSIGVGAMVARVEPQQGWSESTSAAGEEGRKKRKERKEGRGKKGEE